MSRTVHVLAFPNAQVLDVTGPLQVFASTNDLARQRGLPLPYAVSVVAAQAQPVVTSAGLALVAEPLPAADAPCDTLVIAGGWGYTTPPMTRRWWRGCATRRGIPGA